ncbi:MAG: T9SS type A sorting domain-containing protein [Flavobacteriales bacterium]|nr:T9SS type A sorting domain-containing protein [Flavobacteriales bacterium]
MKHLLAFLSTLLIFSFISAQQFEIYVSDAGNFNEPPWQILKFDQDGSNGEVFTTDELAWPQDIVFIEDQGVVLISNLNTNRINRHDAATGEFIDIFASGIGGPTRMKVGSDGLLYVLQWSGNGLVKRYDLNGNFVDDFTDAAVLQSIGLDWDSNGDLYVSSFSGGSVRKFNQSGEDQGIFFAANALGPTNIWFNDVGELLVCDWNGSTVKRFDSDGQYIDEFISGLSQSEGVDIFPNGNILIGNGGTSAVKLFSNDGTFIEDIILSGTLGLIRPNAAILREMPVSMHEIAQDKFEVFPNIGTQFKLQISNMGQVNSIEVFNELGQIVHKMDTNNSLIWNAEGVQNGHFFIRVLFKDGTFEEKSVLVEG